MNNAGTLLLILLGCVGIIILCVVVPPMQTVIGVGSGILAFTLFLVTTKKILRSLQLKEYFWQVFPECDKDYLNYGFIRRSLKFQNERKEKLLQYDPEKAKELITLENDIKLLHFAIVVTVAQSTKVSNSLLLNSPLNNRDFTSSSVFSCWWQKLSHQSLCKLSTGILSSLGLLQFQIFRATKKEHARNHRIL